MDFECFSVKINFQENIWHMGNIYSPPNASAQTTECILSTIAVIPSVSLLKLNHPNRWFKINSQSHFKLEFKVLVQQI